MRTALQKLTRREIALIIVLTIVCISVLVVAYLFLPIGDDYHSTFHPAPLAVLRGESPYNGYGFFYPPWTILPLLPISLLPEKIGNEIFFFSCLLTFVLLLHKYKVNLATTIIFLVSPPVLVELWSSNINWLVLLGYLMPPQIGLFFVLMKPQVGGAMALFWFVEAWHKGGFRQVIKTFLPVSIITIITLFIFPGWFQSATNTIGFSANISFWPLSIPIGLVLVALMLKHRDERFAYMASPFLSPYFTINSLSTVILGLVSSPWLTTSAVVGMWIAIFIGIAV